MLNQTAKKESTLSVFILNNIYIMDRNWNSNCASCKMIDYRDLVFSEIIWKVRQLWVSWHFPMIRWIIFRSVQEVSLNASDWFDEIYQTITSIEKGAMHP